MQKKFGIAVVTALLAGARRGADQLSAFHDYVILEGRSFDVYAEPVQPGFILPREESSIAACLPNMV
jgi:hypothetical protein